MLGASSSWELRVDEPMLDMRFFRNPAFSTGTGGMILVFLAMYGVMFLITQYFQLVLGYSAARRRAAAAADGADHADRRPAHAPPGRRGSAPTGGRRRHALRSPAWLAPVPGLDAPTPRIVYVLVCLVPLVDGHGADDVADDGLDHVGGAGPPGRAPARR